jgi:ATP-binding cassette, subfamily C (CFTR/MRP), member 1
MFEALLTQGGLLRDAARVLVTHGLQYVTRADEVVVMDGGRIVERGVYADLIRADGSVMASLARTFTAEATKAVRKDDIVVVADVPTGVPSTREPNAVALASTVSARMQGALVGHPVLIPASKPEPVKDGGGKPATAGRIVRDEDRARGTVPLAVYALYVAGIGGRWAGAGVILFTAAVAGAQIATSAWLAEWADQAGTTAGVYVCVYVCVCVRVCMCVSLDAALVV